MVFGLLRLEICERFTFSSTDSFLKLLTAVRGIEASLRKKQNEPTGNGEKESLRKMYILQKPRPRRRRFDLQKENKSRIRKWANEIYKK
jgi:hypothetical protein